MMFNRDTTYDAYNNDNSNIENFSGDDETEMAAKLYWRPIVDNDNPLAKQLKWILQEEEMVDHHMTIKDIGFLKGLRAAGIEDAQKLIDAIEKYGYIELFLKD